jgi:hypothetical protein
MGAAMADDKSLVLGVVCLITVTVLRVFFKSDL